MSDAERPRRKFWQFHLSTAILLMLFAGPLGWLLASDWQMVTDDAPLEQYANPAKEPIPPRPTWPPEAWVDFKDRHFLLVFFLEHLVALLALIGFGVLVEFVVRRREARQT